MLQLGIDERKLLVLLLDALVGPHQLMHQGDVQPANQKEYRDADDAQQGNVGARWIDPCRTRERREHENQNARAHTAAIGDRDYAREEGGIGQAVRRQEVETHARQDGCSKQQQGEGIRLQLRQCEHGVWRGFWSLRGSAHCMSGALRMGQVQPPRNWRARTTPRAYVVFQVASNLCS